ncbi:chaperone NapD [Sulfurospirillum deleyianum]|uniref:Chaperone NapD n=1 Tax=Sulfurospirillum deleyianum (strain ATCC 51133 / DSM 6946 / 5175) TaxID=525898 RepID=D1B0Z4_SULD5|nr:chaperone NapD [Sulfurospirillum deleyianum]ACZ11764.1 periplasmic nitrate reductase component NapD [Sulfurospirillum deleyianum DSM 6946]
MNISSIVVQAKPLHVKALIDLFDASDFCDYHFSDENTGKIVLTIEGENIDEEMQKLKKIEATPHVISATMMMAYSEDELDIEREKLQNADAVPSVLNDDNVKIEDIIYRGDLKKKIH